MAGGGSNTAANAVGGCRFGTTEGGSRRVNAGRACETLASLANAALVLPTGAGPSENSVLPHYNPRPRSATSSIRPMSCYLELSTSTYSDCTA